MTINGIERPTENWTKFPNCILDSIDRYTPQEFKILGIMIRQLIGKSNRDERFSLEYLVTKSGMSKPTVNKAITGLLNKQQIAILHTGKRNIRYFDVIWTEPRPVKDFNRLNNFPSTSKEYLPEPVKEVDTYKRTLSKEHYNNNIIFDYWVSFKSLIQHQKKTDDHIKAIKKAVSKYSEQLVKDGIKNYATVLASDEYYFSHKWTLDIFLTQKNALPQFLPEAEPLNNYKRKNTTQPKQQSTHIGAKRSTW
jgi:hypothetical protein